MVQRVPRDSEPPPIDVSVQSERLLRKGGRGFRDDEEAFQKDAHFKRPARTKTAGQVS